MINYGTIIMIHDGSIISKEMEYRGIEYLLRWDSKNIITSNFVGFVLSENQLIASFPKNYSFGIKEEDLQTLLNLVILFKKQDSNQNYDENSENFPIDSYLYVCEYFLDKGLFKKITKSYKKGYNDKISWPRTIRNSTKIINNNNLLFIPFVTEQNMDINVFITECMKEVLTVGYSKFGKHFGVGVPFDESTNLNFQYQTNHIISKLKEIYTLENKDDTKRLITSIIRFILWSSKNQSEVAIVIRDFQNIWQNMISAYLNNEFSFDQKTKSVNFNSNKKNGYRFLSEYSHAIEYYSDNSRNFNVRYDHILMEESNVFLFDSKYYKEERSELDYKQFSYYYTIQDYIYRNTSKTNLSVYSGLILPTSKESYRKTHINTKNKYQHEFLQNLEIIEYYFNINEIINWYLSFNT